MKRKTRRQALQLDMVPDLQLLHQEKRLAQGFSD